MPKRVCWVLAAAVLPAVAVLAVEPPPRYAEHSDLLYWLDAGERRDVRGEADWRVRRTHIVAAMEQVMGPAPAEERGPVEVRIVAEERFDGFIRRKIRYAALPGNFVPAYLFLPTTEGKHPAALALHPTGAPGKDIVAGETDKVNRGYAVELARRGWVVLAPDYPTMGEPQADAYDLGYESVTMQAIYNHSRGVDLLQSLAEVDAEKIAAIGHSLGGHNALFVAVFDERIRATVTSCGFNSFAKYYKGDLTGWAQRRYMPRVEERYGKDPARMPFDFTEVLGAIAPRALFVSAPVEDSNFEISGVRDCLRAARPVYEQVFGAGERLRATHPKGGHDFPLEVRRAAYAFLESWVGVE